MPTRTQTKQDWRRCRYSTSDPYDRLVTAYDWLRAGVKELPDRKHPDKAVRDAFPALAAKVTAAAIDVLTSQAAVMDKQGCVSLRQRSARSARVNAFRAAKGDSQRLAAASDWFRWSAAQLARRAGKPSVPGVERTACAALRTEVLAATADVLARLAERTDRDCES